MSRVKMPEVGARQSDLLGRICYVEREVVPRKVSNGWGWTIQVFNGYGGFDATEPYGRWMFWSQDRDSWVYTYRCKWDTGPVIVRELREARTFFGWKEFRLSTREVRFVRAAVELAGVDVGEVGVLMPLEGPEAEALRGALAAAGGPQAKILLERLAASGRGAFKAIPDEEIRGGVWRGGRATSLWWTSAAVWR